MKKLVDDLEIDVPSDYEPVAAMVIDEEGMRCFTYALMYQSRRLKECLLDPYYAGRKTWLSTLLRTNLKMMEELDR
jgi:hypothetical protein